MNDENVLQICIWNLKAFLRFLTSDHQMLSNRRQQLWKLYICDSKMSKQYENGSSGGCIVGKLRARGPFNKKEKQHLHV